jgi:lipopolysaccharide/colanic/teichoic acid biosynthesis glycosyltransferase
VSTRLDVEQVQIKSAAEITLQGESLATFYRRVGKRAFDLAVAIPLLLLTTPLILLLAGAVVLTSGPGPFYGSVRVGRRGKFKMLKLRTMVRDADRVLEEWRRAHPELAATYEKDFKLADDPRVTWLGKILRRTSLDELPQFWNVIVGDMSLVGPRPVNQDELRKYGALAEQLLTVKPGLTGRWQIGGAVRTPYPERIYIELDYCRTLSFLDDLRVLFITLAAPIRG